MAGFKDDAQEMDFEFEPGELEAALEAVTKTDAGETGEDDEDETEAEDADQKDDSQTEEKGGQKADSESDDDEEADGKDEAADTGDELGDKAENGEENSEEEELSIADLHKELTSIRQAVNAVKAENRTVRRTNAALKEEIARLNTKRKQSVDDDEDEDGTDTGASKEQDDLKSSPVMQLSNALNSIQSQRGDILEGLREQMKLTEKFNDVDDICTRSRFDDIFEVVAMNLVRDNPGLDPVVAAMQVELQVWQKPNPYAYMYSVIKKYHPDFVSANQDGDSKKKQTKQKKAPAKAPSSISGKGGSSNKTGYTAARLDEMDEDEFAKVPADIREKYMKDELK